MPIKVPIKSVTAPRHLSGFVFTTPNAGGGLARLEVYTGWVLVDFAAGTTHLNNEVITFVPLKPNVVQEYQDGDLLDFTLTATVCAMADVDDEANYFALDTASVKLEPQSFPAIQGPNFCLVLRASVAVHNGRMHRITYQVTALTKTSDRGTSEIPLDLNRVPD